MILGETAQPFGNAIPLEVFALLEVVAGVVCGRPMRDRIDVELYFFRGLRLANKHLAGRHKPGNQFKLGIVQMERFAVHVAVHLGFARKIFVGQLSATICNIPDSCNSLSDCVARIIAAFSFLHVFCA